MPSTKTRFGVHGEPDENMYQRSASAPRSCSTDHGSMMLPRDFDIFRPSLVDDVREAHDVAVRRAVEHERVDREQRVEPAAGLVDGLADEVGGEALRERFGVLERVVELRGRHRPGVEPRVEHRRDARSPCPSRSPGSGS